MRFSLAAPRRRAIAGIAIVLAAGVLLGAGPPASWTTPAAVDLGTAAEYAVLAGGGITDTGPSVISGDVGTHPLAAIPDLLDKEATGRVDRAGPRPRLAQRDLASAFASVALLPSDGIVSPADDRTLTPGVYAVAEARQGFSGSLTLDGQGAPNPVWIFVVADDLVTTPRGTFTLVNGAQACNVFWHVGRSATLAARSTFAGSILAMTSVTVGSGATVAGRLLARTGAVTLAGASITVPVCAPNTTRAAPQPAAADALVPSSRTGDAAAGSLPAILPIVLLVLAALLGEPRARHRRRPSAAW